MERHLDPLVAARERLVDAVVDHLVDEVMEPPGARRADVHARSQADGLEPLEHGDVLGGIGGFTHEKSPANSLLAGTQNSSKTSGRYRCGKGLPRRLLRPLGAALRHESLALVIQLSQRAPGSAVAGAAGPPRDRHRRGPGECPGATP